jgi:hypothetical protein
MSSLSPLRHSCSMPQGLQSLLLSERVLLSHWLLIMTTLHLFTQTMRILALLSSHIEHRTSNISASTCNRHAHANSTLNPVRQARRRSGCIPLPVPGCRIVSMILSNPGLGGTTTSISCASFQRSGGRMIVFLGFDTSPSLASCEPVRLFRR